MKRGKLSKFDDKICPFEMTFCENFCMAQVLRKNMDNYIRNECIGTEIKCEYFEIDGYLLEGMAMHLKLIKKECDNLKDRVQKLESRFDKMD